MTPEYLDYLITVIKKSKNKVMKPKVSSSERSEEVIEDTIMTIGKSNRMNQYMKEIEEIDYEYLQKNKFGITPLQRKFYEHRKRLLEGLISNYINSNDEE